MIPDHVAVIPDGNRRFARLRGLSITEAYRAGAAMGVELVDWCLAAGVARLSTFASSAENVVGRPPGEVIAMFQALAFFCGAAGERPGVVVHVIGDLGSLPDHVPGREEMHRLAVPPKHSARLVVHVVANYSAADDVSPLTCVPLVDRKMPLRHLRSAAVPPIDLLIRTGGQRRLSGFLPHQSSFAELWFTDTLWPAFTRAEFDDALIWYARQDRTYGE